MSFLSGKIFETDYKTASLSVRKMNLVEFVNQMADKVKSFSILPDLNLEPQQRLIDLYIKIEQFSEKHAVFNAQETYVRDSWDYTSKIAKGGELEYDFWHCLDRFYYEVYLPWRNEKSHITEALKSKKFLVANIHTV